MAASIGNNDGDPGFQIAPMVDVVFVLLLFFMAAAAVKQKEFGLPADLPVPGPTDRIDVALVIGISSDGRVTMNDFVYGQPGDKALHALREKLTTLADPLSNVIKDPVVIHPDNNARQERLMDVLNACSEANVTKLTFN